MKTAGNETNPKLIDGRAIAHGMELDAVRRARDLRDQGILPRLAIVYRGIHADALSYRKTIMQRAARAGLDVQVVPLEPDCTAQVLLHTLETLNQDDDIHAVLVQTPLPMEQRRVVADHLVAEKDVEGITAVNLGRLVLDEARVLPCTPAAIVALIDSRIESLVGRHVVVVNRSPTVGRPLSQLLLSRRATVTVCSSATTDLAVETRRGEVLVVAIGRARAIGAAYVRTGAVVIDVGINADPQGSGVCGDVDLPSVLDRVAAITPVPGGVGPVTTAMLIANAMALAGQRLEDALGS